MLFSEKNKRKTIIVILLSIFLVMMTFPFYAEAKKNNQNLSNIKKKCLDKIKSKDIVKIKYNFNNLKIKRYKTEIIPIECGETYVAGCFKANNNITTNLEIKNIMIDNYICQIPYTEVKVNYDTSYIYLNNYTGCQLRVVFRHELQHFAIWKVAQNKYIKDLKRIITEKAKEDVCIQGINCRKTENIYDELFLLADKIRNKWEVITNKNNQLLDEIDHNDEKQVNYVVCNKKNYFYY